MEEIVKGLIEIASRNKEAGLILVLCFCIIWMLYKHLMKQVKWREEWIEKLHLALISNKKAMEEGRDALVDVQRTMAELDTDAHDVLLQMENDREVDARVAAELERRSHGRRSG